MDNPLDASRASLAKMLVSDVNALLQRWPRERPLACLFTAGVEREGGFCLAAEPTSHVEFASPDAFDALQRALPQPIGMGSHLTGRGWMLCLSYELGGRIEPSAGARPRRRQQWPYVTLMRCEGCFIGSHSNGWTPLGDPTAIPVLRDQTMPTCTTGTVHAAHDRAAYEANVATIIDLIHAGDCFQANIAQRFSCSFNGSVRALAAAAFDAAQPQFGAVLETSPGRAVVSMSPELFLDISDNTIRTKPIKGTRPAHVDPAALEASSKDSAELAMIVDLMRNDLGRLCVPGTIDVTSPRSIESLPTVHHAVAEVQGSLAKPTTLGDVLRATFPPGSITGAPKIRAMQIIDDLEATERGPYCGAVGWLDDSGRLVLNVSIRTIAATGTPGASPDLIDGRLDYFAGCGIVAESTPADEYAESIAKQAVFEQTCARLGAQGHVGPSLDVEVLDVGRCNTPPVQPTPLGEQR